MLRRTPTDDTLSVLWHLDPRLLTQFLNRRLPFFLFRTLLYDNDSGPDEYCEVLLVRQKMSESVHIIKMHYRQWGLLNDEFSAHFLADGSLFRFELHDLDENGACADTEHFEDPQKRFAAVYHVDTMLVLDPGRAMELGKRSFTYFFDGKWGRPADLVVCPRLYSRLDKSLMAYWCVQRVIVDGVLAKPIEKVSCLLVHS
ncbi:hypothetical protein ACMFMF_004731 [Clarireedia jacksonii]